MHGSHVNAGVYFESVTWFKFDIQANFVSESMLVAPNQDGHERDWRTEHIAVKINTKTIKVGTKTHEV